MAGITTLVYWIGNIGIAGKCPGWSEPYNPDRTIGELIQTLIANRCTDANKRIEILKHEFGNINKYDKSNPYWSHDTKLSEWVATMGGFSGKYIQLVFCQI